MSIYIYINKCSIKFRNVFNDMYFMFLIRNKVNSVKI